MYIYEIIHIYELRLKMKVKNDHRSIFSNLSNRKEDRSLNSNNCYIPRSSKHIDTCKWWAGYSAIGVIDTEREIFKIFCMSQLLSLGLHKL